MRILALVLLMPVAICTAATPSPAPQGASDGRTAATAAGPPRTSAKVTLAPAAGSSARGNLLLTNEGTSVSIKGEITGLMPGQEHGFHVHEVGDCSAPDFQSAGEHLNPTKDPHGGPKSSARHLGDIPNAKADKEGRAAIDVSLKGATLADKDGGPNQILGKAMVVHAMPDDYKTQPSGGSGARIACGVIR